MGDFIYDQRETRHIRFGIKYSDYNGCGWIAAYNLLTYLKIYDGAPESFASQSGVQRCALLFGLFGTNPFKLRRFLYKKGVKTKLCVSLKKAPAAMAGAECGIIMYFHNKGAHFVMFSREASNTGGAIHLYNADYGRRGHVEESETFIKGRCKFGLVFLMTV